MKPSQACIDLVKQFEGFRAQAYQDVIGVWTIGYGTAHGVAAGMTVTQEQAEAMLRADLERAAAVLAKAIHAPVTQHQFDAICSLAYNCGTGAIAASTLLVKVNQRDMTGAANEFARWCKAGGHDVPGLVRRRAAERDWFQREGA